VSSTAYVSLVAAADGTDNITAYCATITSPGQSAAHRPTSAEVDAHAVAAGKSDSHRSTVDTDASSGTATETEAATAPQVSTQAGAGSSHKPAAAGRP